MKISIKDKNGFALNELVLVIAIIGLASALAIPSVTHAVEWASEKAAKSDLIRINDAVELLKLEEGADAVPQGSNDLLHHEKVIDWIKNSNSSTTLKNIDKIKIERLKSLGNKDDFYFIEYKGHQYERVLGKSANTSKNERFKTTETTSFDRLKRNTWEEGIWVDSSKSINPKPEESKSVNEVNDFLRKKRAASAVVEKKQFFEKPGAHQWVVPEGVQDVSIELVGGGGSGAKAKLYQKLWGSLTTLEDVKKDIDRYGFAGPVKMNDHQISLEGPLKLNVLYPHECFVTDLYLTINGEKHSIPRGKEVVVTWDFSERADIDFYVNGPGGGDSCWKKGRKHGKMRYHDSHLFQFSYIKVQYKDTVQYRAGNGGGAGGYSKKNFSKLKGGETVFLNIGAGGSSSSGGDTSARINEYEFKAFGGEQGTDSMPGQGGIGIGGDINDSGNAGITSTAGGSGGEGYTLGNNGNVRMGAGGSGSASPESQHGGSGNCGMAIITYKI